jgi:hypothetical protein
MTAMKKPEITSRILPVSLTDAEIDERAHALAKSVAAVTRLKKQAKMAAAEWKEKISDEEEVSNKLTNAVNSGVEDREVQCEVRISQNVAEIVRLDTFETIDVRPATKEEIRNQSYQTTIYDHGAGEPSKAPATEPETQPEAVTTTEVIDAEVIESAPAPLAIEAKETDSQPKRVTKHRRATHDASDLPIVQKKDEDTTPELEEVPLRVSPSLLQAVLLGKGIDSRGEGGTVFRHGGSHYIVDSIEEDGSATAFRIKMADLYPGETKSFWSYALSFTGSVVFDTEGEKWVIVSDTTYIVTTEIKAEAA